MLSHVYIAVLMVMSLVKPAARTQVGPLVFTGHRSVIFSAVLSAKYKSTTAPKTVTCSMVPRSENDPLWWPGSYIKSKSSPQWISKPVKLLISV